MAPLIIISLSLTFDWSVKTNHNAPVGFVIRDSHGQPTLASSRSIGHSDVLTVEALRTPTWSPASHSERLSSASS